MKKILYSVLGLCIMMPVVSCQKENVNSADLGKEIRGERTSFVAVAENAVKTTIQDSDKEAADYGKVSWAVGDQVKFVYEIHEGEGPKTPGYQESDALTADDIVDGAATFTADLPAGIKTKVGTGEAHLYAVYPASVAVDYSDGSTFKMTVPDIQDGTFASSSIALAKLDKTAVDAPLEFKNFCGLFRVTTTDANVRKLIVTSKTDIAGLVNVTFTGPAVKSVLEGKKEITVNVNGAGTYYVAALPGALDGVNVFAYDENGTLIGDASTSNTISLARAQMRSMGTIGSSSYYFVKVEAAGAKDGSSWDNAADLASMTTLLATSASKKICMAAGTYTESAEMKVNQTGASFSIIGGYPASATGMDMSGRDIANNSTVVDCNSLRGIVATKGDVKIDGITFQNAAKKDNSTPGSVLVLQGVQSFSAANCKFVNNTHTSTGTLLGVIRLASTTATFKNCEFSGNSSSSTSSSTKLGSVIYQYATATLTLDGCEFYNNTAASFGTVLYTVGPAIIKNCVIGKAENGNTSSSRGGAICIDGSSKLTISDTQFKANSGAIGGAIYVNKIADDATLNITNCSFSANIATNASNGGGAVGISGDSKTYTGMLEFSHCDFDSNTTPSCGGAVWANGASVSFTDCSFTSNKVTAEAASENALGGGAVRVSGGTVNMINCEFTGNKSDNTGANKGQGGAIFVGSTGTLRAEKCLFSSNVAKAAMGAIHVAGKLEARDCSFIDNNQSSIALSGSGKAYIDNCYFTYTEDTGKKPNAIISPAATTTEVRINNSVLTGNWGYNGNYQIYGPGDMLIVNTTMLGQIGSGNVGVAADGKFKVINSIVANAASNGTGKSFTVNANATADCSYTLYSTLSGPVTVASSLAGIKYTTDTNKNFPVGYTWYETNAAAMFTNNQSSTLAVSDCRETLHFYKWDGMVPTIGEKTFNNATLDDIQKLVNTVDADFATWLGDALGKDIRGVSRDESSMWPGSYQEAGSTKAGLDNFNVK